MNNNTQIKHYIWWIVKQIGKLPEYKDFIKEPLSEDACKDIDELVAYIKLNY